MAPDLQATFNQIKDSGKNTVEGIIQWLQDSKVIDKAKETADKVRAYFADAADKNDITADNFKEAMTKLAGDQKKNVEELSKNLSEYGTTLTLAVEAGASALKNALGNK